MELDFAADAPPLAAIAAAKIAGIPITLKQNLESGSVPALLLPNGERLRGTHVLLKHVGRIASNLDFYGKDANQSSKIDEWIDIYAPIFSSGSEFEGACKYVDEYLLQSTFLVGNSLSIADISIWACLAGAGLRWESLRKSKKYRNLVRWFNSISGEHDAVLSEVIATYLAKKGSAKSVTSKSKESQASNSRSTSVENGVHATETTSSRSAFEVDLRDAEVGKVKLRFAPEPSGYLEAVGGIKKQRICGADSYGYSLASDCRNAAPHGSTYCPASIEELVSQRMKEWKREEAQRMEEWKQAKEARMQEQQTSIEEWKRAEQARMDAQMSQLQEQLLTSMNQMMKNFMDSMGQSSQHP